jgi:hypothetical protein
VPTHVITAERITEQPGAGRLGRHYRYDSRSAAYPYQRTAARTGPVEWPRHIGILDQDGYGSCTGEAATGALATDPLFPALQAALAAAHATLDQPFALGVYSDAEKLDGGAGLPGEDQGSSGTSVCQVARNRGYIAGYTWCQDTADALDALQHGPVLLGVNWYSSFDRPSDQGVVSLPAGATIRGGHEIVCRAYDGSDLLWCDNSWGTGWGKAGRFAFPTAVMERLFTEQGDCAVPLPLSVAPPLPGPQPDPAVHIDAADRALWQALPAHWLTRHHTGDNAAAARAVAAWAAAKGLS